MPDSHRKRRVRVTNVDVARVAGVSTMTVSRVLNGNGRVSEATRKRVRLAMEELNYQPNQLARSLARGHSQTLGLVLPDITNPFFSDIVRGAEDAAWEAGYMVALANAVEDLARERAAIRTLAAHRVVGVIACSARLPDSELQDLLSELPIAVLINRQSVGDNTISLSIDDAAGAHLAVNHLLASGRRRFAFIAGPARSQSARNRRAGFFDAVAGAAPEPLVGVAEPTETSGYEAVEAWLRTEPGGGKVPFDALVAHNDLIALGAIRALTESGLRVPEDVAVVGCDDIRLASLVSPTLTTLGVDKYQLGRDAANAIFAGAKRASEKRRSYVPELIVRESAP